MISRILGGAVFCIGGAGLLGLMFISVGDAIMRSLGAPFIGAHETSEAFLAVCVALAVPISIYRGKAVSIDGFVGLMPAGMARALTVGGELLAAGFCVVLAYSMVQAGFDARDFAEQSALLRIPYFYMYQILSAGFGLSALAFVARAWISYKAETVL
ncbi:TRAP transporter small permease [Ahrensia kielensis]|uniref:TRAP transporter small permease protein n=1 Tax=Ahrensia kielensis TaxID=76980 RepID=A0ABU9TA40_9HYPH